MTRLMPVTPAGVVSRIVSRFGSESAGNSLFKVDRLKFFSKLIQTSNRTHTMYEDVSSSR